MRFYTFVKPYGNDILLRGWDDEEGGPFMKRVKFNPTLFLPSKEPTKYKTLDGQFVTPIQPGGIKDCREFMEQYNGVDGITVHGFERYLYQFIGEEYPGHIEYDMDKIKLWSLDIETSAENGFPKPMEAREEVLLITLKNFKTKKLITFGSRPYEPTRDDTNYIYCKSEFELLETFVGWWESVAPEVITGWNVNMFDITYLCNRIGQRCGEKTLKRLSPWGLVKSRTKHNAIGVLEQQYDIAGVSVLDYLDIYKKFTYTARESYRLDVIAELELGQKKLDHSEFDTFKDFYTGNWKKFVDYNLVDVDLVDQLEEKMKLIDLVVLMAYDAKCNYADTFAQVRLWDIIIYNYLKKKNIVLSPGGRHDKPESFAGAYVKEPIPGGYEWITSFDLNSLYPSLIRFLNISPETLLDNRHPNADVEKMITKDADMTSEVAVAANGSQYTKDFQGMMPKLVIKMYKERVGYKKEMLKHKQKLVDIETEMRKRNLL